MALDEAVKRYPTFVTLFLLFSLTFELLAAIPVYPLLYFPLRSARVNELGLNLPAYPIHLLR